MLFVLFVFFSVGVLDVLVGVFGDEEIGCGFLHVSVFTAFDRSLIFRFFSEFPKIPTGLLSSHQRPLKLIFINKKIFLGETLPTNNLSLPSLTHRRPRFPFLLVIFFRLA
jgi:hypothetical protein